MTGTALALVIFLSPQSRGAATLRVTDGVSTVTIVDNGGNDSSPIVGAVSYSGTLNGWNILVASGTTKPVLGSANSPDLDFTYQVMRGAGSQGTLTMLFSDNNFSIANGSNVTVSASGSLGTNVGPSVTVQTFYDFANTELATTTLLTSHFYSGPPSSSYSGSDASGSFAVSLSTAFTMKLDIALPVGITSSGDVDMKVSVFDSDVDGIPDAWEDAHGLNKNNPNDAALDFDGDGASNLDEYRADTDPNDLNSVFRMTSISLGAGASLQFSSRTGLIYHVQYRTALGSSNFVELTQFVATALSSGVVDANANISPSRYYRVSAQRSTDAPVFAVNELGFVNIATVTGSNYVHRPYLATADNHITALFPSVPDDTYLARFNPALQAFDEVNVYEGAFGGWLDTGANPSQTTLLPGDLFLFDPPNAVTLTFVGEVLPVPLIADDVITWTNTTGGNWSEAANWSPNQVPGLTNTVFITNAGTYTVVLDVNTIVSSFVLGGGSGTQTFRVNHDFTSVQSDFKSNAIIQLLGGRLFGTNTISGLLECQGQGGSFIGVLTIAPGGTMNVTNANAALSGVLVNQGTVFLNQGVFSFTGGSFVTNSGLWLLDSSAGNSISTPSDGAFYNTGTFRKFNSAGGNNILAPFFNSGSVEVLTGTLAFNQAAMSGSWSVANGATLNLGGSGPVDGIYNVASGGTLNLQSGGSLDGTYSVEPGGTLNLNSGFFSYSSVPTFAGGGSFRFSGSGSLLLQDDLIPNLQLVQGLLYLSPNFQGGSITNLTLDGPTLVGTNTVAGLLQCPNCSIVGTLNISTNGTMEITNAAVNGTLLNQGTVNLRGGINLVRASAITNSGVLLLDSPGPLTITATGGGTFQNKGTLRKIGASGNNLLADFSNAGFVDVQAGVLAFNTFTQTAGLLLVDSQLNCNGVLNLLGGRLTGSGIVSASVNSSGHVAPGSALGALSISGNYTQNTSGVLEIELGGTEAGQSDRLVVTGTASLAGELNLRLTNGYTPQPDAAFLVLTNGAQVGTFNRVTAVPNTFSATTLNAPGGIIVKPFSVQLPNGLLLSEDFEGVLDPRISITPRGGFASPPAVRNTSALGGAKAFGFGKSSCPASCFWSYATFMTINFPGGAILSHLSFKSVELDGDFGSAGYIFVDPPSLPTSEASAVAGFHTYATPTESNTFVVPINSWVTNLVIAVEDIASASETYIDDIQVFALPFGIVSGPTNQTVMVGEPVTFSVLASGTQPLFYQWRFNGVNLPGETNATLFIPSAQPTDSGRYTVVVQNDLGAVTSDPATLFVQTPPQFLADKFADRHFINSLSGLGRSSNTFATLEPGEPQHAGKPGGHSVWLGWTAAANGVATFHTRGSSFDTLLAVYTGDALSSLASVTSDDDSGGFFTSEVKFNASVGTTYNIAIDGLGGATGDIVLSWSLLIDSPPVPIILIQPTNRLASLGSGVSFNVVAMNALAYQWLFNGVPIRDATNAELLVTNVSFDSIGIYAVSVMNGEQFVLSTPVILEVLASGLGAITPTVEKFEDLFSSNNVPITSARARTISKPQPHLVSVGAGSIVTANYGGATQLGEPNHGGILGGASRWQLFRYDNNGGGVLTITTEGSTVPTALAAYTGTTLAALTTVTQDAASMEPNEFAMIRFRAEQSVPYPVALDTRSGRPGRIKVNWSFVTAPQLDSLDLIPVIPGSNVLLSVNVSGGNEAFIYQWHFGTNPIASATNTVLSLTNLQPDAFGEYRLVVTYSDVVIAERTIQLTNSSPEALAILRQPRDVNGTVGESASFVVQAGAPGEITYQWQQQKANGTKPFKDIAGATDATYTLPLLKKNSDSNFRVVVLSDGNSLTSGVARLQVFERASIKMQPKDVTALDGKTVKLNAKVNGTALSYQWYFNNTPIFGATSSTLTIPDLEADELGDYYLGAQNAVSAATTRVAHVTFLPALIKTQPKDVTATAGGVAKFKVKATGAALSYQWYFNDALLPGATNTTLTLANVHSNDDGDYYVIASNAVSTNASRHVRLTVVAAKMPNALAKAESSTGAQLRIESRNYGIQLTLIAPAGEYEVLVSSDLRDWSSAGTVTVTSGPAVVLKSRTLAMTFYRVRLVSPSR